MITFALGKYDFDCFGTFTFNEESNKNDLAIIANNAPITMELLEKQKDSVIIGFVNSPLKFGGMVNISNRGPVLMMNLPALFADLDLSTMPEKYRAEIEDKVVASTLVHELVHFEQFKSGRIMMAGDFVDWEGELHFPKIVGIDYFNSPWEQEAFKAQAEFMQNQGMGHFDSTMNMFKQMAEPIKNIFTGV